MSVRNSLLAEYVRILTNKGPESSECYALLRTHASEREFVELANTSRLLYLSMQDRNLSAAARKRKKGDLMVA
jgi:hypothetical protein